MVHGDDLDVATYGRGFWVLDQMSALRQIAAQGARIVSSRAYLFQPGETYAIRVDSMNGTPLPHEQPQLQNPPSGVLAYYWLKTPAAQPLKIELLDGSGSVRACVASDRPMRRLDTEALNVQAIWEQHPVPPSAAAGMHRIALGGTVGRGFGFGGRANSDPPVKDACIPVSPEANSTSVGGQASSGRGGAGLRPGQHTLRLTVDGETYTQPVRVKEDPRGVPGRAN